MGALDVVKKAADKGDLQAITLMGVCHAIGYPLLSLHSPLPSLPYTLPSTDLIKLPLIFYEAESSAHEGRMLSAVLVWQIDSVERCGGVRAATA